MLSLPGTTSAQAAAAPLSRLCPHPCPAGPRGALHPISLCIWAALQSLLLPAQLLPLIVPSLIEL